MPGKTWNQVPHDPAVCAAKSEHKDGHTLTLHCHRTLLTWGGCWRLRLADSGEEYTYDFYGKVPQTPPTAWANKIIKWRKGGFAVERIKGNQFRPVSPEPQKAAGVEALSTGGETPKDVYTARCYTFEPDEDEFLVAEDKPEQVMEIFDGYIDPKGVFYGTKPTGLYSYKGSGLLHDEFARMYLKKYLGDDYGGIRDPKDALIEHHGWISVTFEFVILKGKMDVSTPHNKRRITEAQKQTLMRLFQLHHKDMNAYFQAIGEGAPDIKTDLL